MNIVRDGRAKKKLNEQIAWGFYDVNIRKHIKTWVFFVLCTPGCHIIRTIHHYIAYFAARRIVVDETLETD